MKNRTVPVPGVAAGRHEELVELVATRGHVRVTELSALFGVSEVTIRSDLRTLDSRGVLRRVRGGAEPASATATDDYDWRRSGAGPMAAALARSGDRIALDGSPQMCAVAIGLARRADLRAVRVLCHGLAAAQLLAAHLDRFEVHLPAGRLLPGAEIEAGAGRPLGEDRFDLAFLGCDGLSRDRVSVHTEGSAVSRRRILATAGRSTLITGPRALGRVLPSVVCEPGELDACILAGEPAGRAGTDLAAELQRQGVQLFETR